MRTVLLVYAFICIDILTLAQQNLEVINVEKNLNNPGEIKLSNVATNIEYIRLEFTAECPINFIFNVHITLDYIFVYSSNAQPLFQFNRQGKFIKKIGNLGRGPGEYMIIRDLTFDDVNKVIYINANYKRKILKYDYNGKFLDDFPVGDNVRRIDFIDKDNLLIHRIAGVPLNSPDYFDYGIIDQTGKIKYLKKGISYLNLPREISLSLASESIVWPFNNSFMVYPINNDTIFEVTTKGNQAKYVINLGNYKFPPDIYYNINLKMQYLDRYVSLTSLFETDNYLFLFFQYNQKFYSAQYNKKTKDLVLHNQKLLYPNKFAELFNNGLINDFDAGINVMPIPLNKTQYYSVLYPVKVLDYFKSNPIVNRYAKFPDKKKVLENLLISLKKEDNPVIMLINLK